MPSKEESLRALATERDCQMAAFLTLWMAIAAEQHPEELKRAMGKVFSLQAIEEQGRRLEGVLGGLQAEAAELRYEINRLKRKKRRMVDG